MTTATLAEKAATVLTEGRLTVISVGADGARALCRGSAGDTTYTLTYDLSGWSCSCPAMRQCSHIAAFRLVVLANPRTTT